MAVRINAEEGYTTPNNVTAAPMTVLTWVRIVTDRNDWSTVWEIGPNSGDYLMLTTDASGVLLYVDSDSGFLEVGTLTVGTWYRVAVTVSGTTAQVYWGAAGAALTNAGTATVAVPTASAMRIGTNAAFAGFWLNGRVANLKHYSAVLTLAEIDNEFSQHPPVRTSNLENWYPFLVAGTTDYSGNARTLTTTGTPTTEDGPPIIWSPHLLAAA